MNALGEILAAADVALDVDVADRDAAARIRGGANCTPAWTFRRTEVEGDARRARGPRLHGAWSRRCASARADRRASPARSGVRAHRQPDRVCCGRRQAGLRFSGAARARPGRRPAPQAYRRGGRPVQRSVVSRRSCAEPTMRPKSPTCSRNGRSATTPRNRFPVNRRRRAGFAPRAASRRRFMRKSRREPSARTVNRNASRARSAAGEATPCRESRS